MLDSLTSRLTGIFDRLRGYGRLTEENVQEALREVRVALLEADVNFKVVRTFVERVRARAVGQEVLRSLTPARRGGPSSGRSGPRSACRSWTRPARRRSRSAAGRARKPRRGGSRRS